MIDILNGPIGTIIGSITGIALAYIVCFKIGPRLGWW